MLATCSIINHAQKYQKEGIQMRIDSWIYEKYGMDTYDYGKRLMKNGLTWTEALHEVDKLMSEVYQENLFGTDFRDVTDKDDIPFNI